MNCHIMKMCLLSVWMKNRISFLEKPGNHYHTKASLYQTFPPEEAYELAKRLEIHYTPKHGSWLNIAEIELNAMTRQCLDRRIDDIHKLEKELSAWESRRNMSQRSVN